MPSFTSLIFRTTRRRLTVHILLAASLSSTLTQFLADSKINPRSIPDFDLTQSQWAGYFTPINLFAGALGLLALSLTLDGNWLIDNVVLPLVGILLACVQIVIDAGAEWLGVGAFVATVLIILMRLLLVAATPLRHLAGGVLVIITILILSAIVSPLAF